MITPSRIPPVRDATENIRNELYHFAELIAKLSHDQRVTSQLLTSIAHPSRSGSADEDVLGALKSLQNAVTSIKGISKSLATVCSYNI